MDGEINGNIGCEIVFFLICAMFSYANNGSFSLTLQIIM